MSYRITLIPGDGIGPEVAEAAVLESIRRNRIALKRPITTPIGTGFPSVNVSLRGTARLSEMASAIMESVCRAT